MVKQIICLVALLSISAHAVAPYYSARSQSVNAARELVGAGWNTNINLCDYEACNINLCGCEGWNGIFSIIPEYSKTFRPYNISRCLLGCTSCFPPCPECTNACNPCKDGNLRAIHITGSQVESRGAGDWLADYFGLPTDYIGCVSFAPYIENFLVDLDFYLGMDAWVKGLFFRIHAPITHTRWDLDCCECMQESIIGCGRYEQKGSNPHWPGYFSSTVVTPTVGIIRDKLVFSFESFMCQCDVIRDANIVFNPICYARMCCQRLAKTGLSDIQMALGWNFFCNEDYHCGLSIRGSAPTGNRPEACYLFEPIIGNGKHWELGCGLTAHWNLWYGNSCNQEYESLGLYLDANITHMFKTKQCRTFDLCGMPLSRYMLAAKFGEPVNNLQAGPDGGPLAVPSKQFQGVYAPLANITTFAVDVSVGVQADIALLLQYCNDNFSYGIGYNFWAKSCEKIELNCACPHPLEENTWALKGDAFMYGFTYDPTTILTNPVALSATQNNATLCNGTNNWPDGSDGLAWAQNPGIDKKQPAWNGNGDPLIIVDALTSTTAQVYTSKDPVFINLCNIDFNGARTKGMSHKIFIHFDYTWHNTKDWVPYLGIGGEVEFGVPCNDNCCAPCCGPRPPYNTDECCYQPYGPYAACDNSCYLNNDTTCCSCAVSQWGIWLKGGIAFS